MKYRLMFLAFVVGACSSNSVVEEQSSDDMENQDKVKKQATAPLKDAWSWSYKSGPKGPDNWASINPDFQMCSTGQMQSPINLVWHKPMSPNPLKMNYKNGNATQMNTPNTVRFDMTPVSSISLNGKEYILDKIEFRSPSEHTLSGNQLPMEIQFYHRSANGLKQAILSLFVVPGQGSNWFDEVWARAMKTAPGQASESFEFNPDQLIPPRQTFYHYEGSLTHPPCLEGVQWMVFNTPLQLSKKQIAAFRGMFGANNRPVQPSNGRKIQNH